MIEAKADPKPDEKADDLGPGVELMDPGVSVKVKKKVHKTSSLQDANCRINPDVAENLTIRTWVNRSERLQGAPLAQEALTSQTPDRVHFG